MKKFSKLIAALSIFCTLSSVNTLGNDKGEFTILDSKFLSFEEFFWCGNARLLSLAPIAEDKSDEEKEEIRKENIYSKGMRVDKVQIAYMQDVDDLILAISEEKSGVITGVSISYKDIAGNGQVATKRFSFSQPFNFNAPGIRNEKAKIKNSLVTHKYGAAVKIPLGEEFRGKRIINIDVEGNTLGQRYIGRVRADFLVPRFANEIQ